MPKRARIHFVSLRSSLVNLPISIYGPLVERSVRPQHLAVYLTLTPETTQRKSDDKIEAYVGWTGMASASSLAHFNAGHSEEGGFETIEIDPQYAQGLGLAQGDIVEIGLLHDLPQAKSVGTEPLTSDDWEIIEIHASHVESTLLSQVRVAKIGQEIDVWVMGRTRVRLRVTSVDPPTKGNALLLTTNTEVSIAPKLHKSKDTPKNPLASGSSSTTVKDQSNPSQPQLSTQEDDYTGLRVLPARLAPNLPHLNHDGPELLAFISRNTLILLKNEIVDFSSSTFLRANFKKLNGPLDPSSQLSENTPEPAARVLNAGGRSEDSAQKATTPPDGEIYVAIMSGLIDGHLVFPALPKDVEDWDIVNFSLSPGNDTLEVDPDESAENSPPSSSVPFLAGVDDILKKCKEYCYIEFLMQSKEIFCHGFAGLLVTGRSGAGKTSIVKAVSRAIQEDIQTLTYIHYVDVAKLTDKPVATLKAQMNYWFDICEWHKPSVLVLDNLHKLLDAEREHEDSFRSRHLTELFLNIFGSRNRQLKLNTRGIMLIATAESTSALHPYINSGHVFKEIVSVVPPNKGARKEILSKLTHDRLDGVEDVSWSSNPPVDFTELATRTEGYSATDLQDLVSRAIHQVAMRSAAKPSAKLELLHDDFVQAQVDFVPLSLREVKLEKSSIAWADIGGLQDTRRVLRETLEWPTKYGPIFKQSPLRLRSGLLLYGYPGCGKTLLASAVAKECGLNFISVKGPEILNKYIGASEKSVRDLFERASAAKPCVLFFDEFDSIAPKRGHDSTGVTDRVVNQMLTQMDGAEGLDGVYVLAATSRPDLIDSALLRPGRLDKSLLCDMPSFEDRKEILEAVARKMKVSPDVKFDDIASHTDGFSGADLQALLYNANLDVIHEQIADQPQVSSSASKIDQIPLQYTVLEDPKATTSQTKAEKMAFEKRLRHILLNSSGKEESSSEEVKTTAEKKLIQNRHVAKALRSMRPSIAPEERNRLTRIYDDFISGRSAALPAPPEAGGVGHRVTLG
ncbi:P-loop containing nucleoside triphosphate hydrolase protein [Crepidotus variabilis]|uniref:Peroxisomal ATPase PEX1 n=1 Tax=Crepidotus variabilis TaxID=179855 RepID=A0A9P6JPS4_9AGAR|nr:P-loop containing nucleoside triphosphate hydrolase protein [Crepidotus variabilis]